MSSSAASVKSATVPAMAAPVSQQCVQCPKEALMLTQDENIVDVRLAVQYQIKDPRALPVQCLRPGSGAGAGRGKRLA